MKANQKSPQVRYRSSLVSSQPTRSKLKFLAQPNKHYILFYVAVCSAVLLPLLVLGIAAPLRLESLLKRGGLVESGAAVINLLTGVLSFNLGQRFYSLYTTGKGSRRQAIAWYAFCGFCLFLVGEEAGWGREPILGWQLLASDAPPIFGIKDVHNAAPHVFQSIFVQWPVLSMAALCALGIAVAWQGIRFATTRSLRQTIISRFKRSSLSQRFIGLGCAVLVFSLVDIPEAFGASYFAGQWTLEESSEVVGSLTFLFAGLTALRDVSMRRASMVQLSTDQTHRE